VVDYSIDQGGQPLVANKASFEGGVLKFMIDAIGGSYEGTVSADGKTLTGTLTQGPSPMALNMVRVTEDAAWPIPEPPKAMAADANPGFDVVTIKPSVPGAQGKGFGGLILGAVDTDSLAMTLRHADTRAKPGHVC